MRVLNGEESRQRETRQTGHAGAACQQRDGHEVQVPCQSAPNECNLHSAVVKGRGTGRRARRIACETVIQRPHDLAFWLASGGCSRAGDLRHEDGPVVPR